MSTDHPENRPPAGDPLHELMQLGPDHLSATPLGVIVMMLCLGKDEETIKGGFCVGFLLRGVHVRISINPPWPG